MKLLITIVQDHIAQKTVQELSKAGFRSTKLSSSGGFLKKGSTTLLIGLEEEKKQEALSIIQRVSDEYRSEDAHVANAIIFVLPMDAYRRY